MNHKAIKKIIILLMLFVIFFISQFLISRNSSVEQEKYNDHYFTIDEIKEIQNK